MVKISSTKLLFRLLFFLVFAGCLARVFSATGGSGSLRHDEDNDNARQRSIGAVDDYLNDQQQQQQQQQEVKTGSSIKIPRACLPPYHHEYPFCDPSLPLDERIDDLISRLTLDEKPMLITARYSPKGAIDRLGIPEYNYGSSCMHGVESRCAPRNKNSINGDDDDRCPTSFPNPNTLGATFNKTLWRAMGKAIGLELRSLWLQNVGENNDSKLPHLGLGCWSPNINLQRDPRWGRNLESPSEDPHLCGSFGTSYTLGLQNNSEVDSRYLQAVSTLKHFTANSLEGRFWNEDGRWSPPPGRGDDISDISDDNDNVGLGASKISRHNLDAHISLYDLETTYLPSFERTVIEGGAAGVMCAFNRINGAPVSIDEYLLKTVLRDRWKFRGYVTSDTGGLNDVRNGHHYTHDWNTTVALAIRAGCDVESSPAGGYYDRHPRNNSGDGMNDSAAGMRKNNVNNSGVNGLYVDFIPTAVRMGFLSESSIDEALRNALGIRFRLGLFDPIDDQPLWKVPPEVVQSPFHVQLSKESTAQGFVLLKNDNNIIPLRLSSNNRAALIGPHIHDRTTMVGNYFGEICRDDKTNGCVTSFYEGFSNMTTTKYSKGCSVSGNDTSGFDEALKVASEAESVVFIGGLDLHLESEDHDRPDIRIPAIQIELLQKVSKVNPRIVLVLLHGGMVGLDDVLEHVEAIVSTGYPGRYAGTALPEALFGINESGWGKSPITWYRNDIVEELNMLDFDMTRPPGRTYRYYTGEPHFRFGFGLNPLTIFELKKVAVIPRNCLGQNVEQKVDSNYAGFCSDLTLSMTVTNKGNRAADEVVMAYFVPLDISESEPASKLREQLFDFERIHLHSGESREVSFLVQANKTLQLADSFGKPVTFPGRYRLRVSNGIELVERTVTMGNDGYLIVTGQTHQAQ